MIIEPKHVRAGIELAGTGGLQASIRITRHNDYAEFGENAFVLELSRENALFLAGLISQTVKVIDMIEGRPEEEPCPESKLF